MLDFFLVICGPKRTFEPFCSANLQSKLLEVKDWPSCIHCCTQYTHVSSQCFPTLWGDSFYVHWSYIEERLITGRNLLTAMTLAFNEWQKTKFCCPGYLIWDEGAVETSLYNPRSFEHRPDLNLNALSVRKALLHNSKSHAGHDLISFLLSFIPLLDIVLEVMFCEIQKLSVHTMNHD